MTKCLAALLTAACLAAAAAAQAQAPSYPSRTITIVVTAAAGGVSDVVARAVGQRMSEDWHQNVVIENKGGGGHIIGAQVVARANPDGHTLLVAEAGTFVLNPTLYPKEQLSYDTEKDLISITGLVRINQALVANNGLAASNVPELIELAKKRPNEISYGTAGVGSAPHMNVLKFENMAKIKLLPIHYRGAAPALNDVMAGHINLMSISLSLVAQPAADKRLKVLGVGASHRVPHLADWPTVAETLPGYEASTWFGLATTAGTPNDIVMKINAEVRKILADPAFQQRFMAPQMFESMAGSPAEFSQTIRTETQTWAKVIREQGLKIE
jgi:tripartite-type tricarboxylate transporter receptor subunit TctC